MIKARLLALAKINSRSGFHRRTCLGFPMYSSTFIFAKRQFDEAFHQLDQQIAMIAKSIPGYLGEESWENVQTGLISNVYYWESLDALQQLVRHPLHLKAKAAQSNWLAGYQIIVSEVIRTYGDSRINQFLPAAVSAQTVHQGADLDQTRPGQQGE